MSTYARVPLIGLWFAFLALPLAGWKNSLWIGLGCAAVVFVVSATRASVQTGSLAGPAG